MLSMPAFEQLHPILQLLFQGVCLNLELLCFCIIFPRDGSLQMRTTRITFVNMPTGTLPVERSRIKLIKLSKRNSREADSNSGLVTAQSQITAHTIPEHISTVGDFVYRETSCLGSLVRRGGRPYTDMIAIGDVIQVR